MFQTNQGPSFSAHQYIISGTSAPSVGSDLLVADGPHFDRGKDQDAGCTAPLEEYVWLIDPSGDESQTMYPCFEHPTLMDLLDGKGISWRHYSPGSGSFWNGPNAIYHVRFGPDWKKNDVWPPTKVLDDIAAGTLAQVTWVIPAGRYSDHSSSTDGSGPSWVASIVNAIGKSPYWAHTAIFITWDDWGGWYDHVAPKIVGSYEYGFRVPMIVVSPYAKSGYVSHVTHDFGSILHFTEAVFGLPSLGYADARADDLSDCFNFHQAPLPFQTISAPYSAEYFLNDRRPLTNPDDY
jgi:phospholipase C